MANKYIGLTIGPLYKTMTRVRATRELWASSYIFSYIMKKMIEKLKVGTEFIIPYTKDKTIFEKGQEVGLFHDRFIFKAKDDDFEKVENIKREVLHDLAEEISNIISEKSTGRIQQFLDRYFQIYFCEAEVEGEYKEVNKQINDYLDSLELQVKFIKQDEKNYLLDLFDKTNKSFLMEDAYGIKNHRFPYIAKIAAKELNWQGVDESKDDDEIDTDIYEQLKKINGDNFKQYHKYIAIVQADGDNLGETIKTLKNNDDFSHLSKALFDFSKEAHEKITKYGGITIFAGGDDLLFFAPVVYGEKNIYQLVDDLAKEFASRFDNFSQSPTLSTGICITYYKYPMGESLESAANLLSNKAKDKEMEKNAIAYEVQKHSGQRFEGVFNRADADYNEFMKLIFNKDDQQMLTSLIHKLGFHSAVIDEIGGDKTKISNYFANFFNKEEHIKHKNIIDSTAKLINAVFNNCKRKEKKEIIFSVLRLKKFLEGGE